MANCWNVDICFIEVLDLVPLPKQNALAVRGSCIAK